MIHQNIIDSQLVEMYHNEASLEDMMTHFDASHSTIYSHLKKAGVIPNRKVSPKWTDEEEAQLVAAREDLCTGQEYADRIPTRSLPAIKNHIKIIRSRGVR